MVYWTVFWRADQRKAPRHCPLWGQFSGDRLIPHTKGHLRGKCFHFTTSLWLDSYEKCWWRLIWIPRRLRVVRHGELRGLIVGEVWGNHPFILFDLWKTANSVKTPNNLPIICNTIWHLPLCFFVAFPLNIHAGLVSLNASWGVEHTQYELTRFRRSCISCALGLLVAFSV